MRSTYVAQKKPNLKTALAAGLTFLCATPSLATSAGPGGIPFSGYMTDIVGAAVTGTINARFYLSIGGTYVWCAQYTNIPVSSGNFFLVLGQTVGNEIGLSLSAPSCTSTGGTLSMSSSLVATASGSSNVLLQVTAQPQAGGAYETLGSGLKIASSLFAFNADALGGTAAAYYAKFDTSGNLLSQSGTTVMSPSGSPLGAMIQNSGLTNIATGTGLTGGPITTTGTVSLANTAVSANAYTRASITVDAQGRLTAAASGGNVPLDAASSAVSGTLPVANGGTGQTSLTSGELLIGNGTGAITSTSSLPIANGGTNNTATATAGGVVYGTGTTMATTAAGTSGYLLASAGASAPTWTTDPSIATIAIGSGTAITKVLHGSASQSAITCHISCAPTASADWATVTIATGDTGWYSANTRIIANFHEGSIGSTAVIGNAVMQAGDAMVDATGQLILRYYCGCYNTTVVDMGVDYVMMR